MKWPNDVLVHGKKVAGILVEMEAELEEVRFLVAGVGINANLPAGAFPEDARDQATSLMAATGRKVDRVQLLAALLTHLEAGYLQWMEKGFDPLLDEVRRKMAYLGEPVEVIGASRRWTGTAVDLAPDGALLVKDPEGRTVPSTPATSPCAGAADAGRAPICQPKVKIGVDNGAPSGDDSGQVRFSNERRSSHARSMPLKSSPAPGRAPAWSLRELTAAGLFAALTAVAAVMTIPMPFVPFTLQVLGDAPPRRGAGRPGRGAESSRLRGDGAPSACPSSPGATAGVQALASVRQAATSLGFILAAWVVGRLFERRSTAGPWRAMGAMALGLAAIHVPGVLVLSYHTGSLASALAVGVAFLPVDIVKAPAPTSSRKASRPTASPCGRPPGPGPGAARTDRLEDGAGRGLVPAGAETRAPLLWTVCYGV